MNNLRREAVEGKEKKPPDDKIGRLFYVTNQST